MLRCPFLIAWSLLALGVSACATPRVTDRGSTSKGRTLTLALPDREGRPVEVGGAGGVRVVDFWASWCTPCREALPALDQLARDLGPRGLQAYAVSIDETREKIQGFLADHPVSCPVLWDQGGAALAGLDATLLPVTLIVDRRGVIREVHQGWSADRPAQVRAEVERLLAEP